MGFRYNSSHISSLYSVIMEEGSSNLSAKAVKQGKL